MKTPRTVLLTGFSPFGGETINPSWDAVAALDGYRVRGHRVVARQLPVTFGESLKALRTALRETSPSLVICIGQAGGRAQLSLERIAINVDDARIPDNAGQQPIDTPIVESGPAAYFSTLPIKAMMAGLREGGFPTEISQTAGTYVCNHVFYGLMHALRNKRSVRGGFIHIPYSPAQAAAHPGAASLPTEVVTEAIRLAIRIALTTTADNKLSAGTEH